MSYYEQICTGGMQTIVCSSSKGLCGSYLFRNKAMLLLSGYAIIISESHACLHHIQLVNVIATESSMLHKMRWLYVSLKLMDQI